MKGKFSSFFMCCLIMILVASCRTAPVYNVTEAEIHTGSGIEPTLKQVEKAILNSASTNQPPWTMKVLEPGRILATLRVRSHIALVEITYTTKSYSITYNGSSNLKYNPVEKTIHNNYNGWIQNLDSAIKFSLASI